MKRRSFLTALGAFPLLAASARLGLGGSAWAVSLGEARAFDAPALKARARALARAGYEPPKPAPDFIRNLTPEQQRAIRFLPEKSLWQGEGLAYRAELRHLNAQAQVPLRLFEVAEGKARPLLYEPSLFELGTLPLPDPLPPEMGFAGFSLFSALPNGEAALPFLMLREASFFQAQGRGGRLGTAARSLSLNPATAGEEFPLFREVYLVRPWPNATELVFHALLDTRSAAGAFRYTIRPGENTVVEVSAAVYPRQAISTMGIAPLAATFFYAPNDRAGVDDIRPRAHEAEGLAAWTGAGERIWRPFVNPGALRFSLFLDTNPRGFGLLQRTRAFNAYQDLEQRYDLRPSVWVEPLDAWGRGAVELIEVPSEDEYHDNIVAFWRPERPVEAGSEWLLNYRLHFSPEEPFPSPMARVMETRVGKGPTTAGTGRGQSRRFLIDFVGGRLPEIETSSVSAVWSVSAGRASALEIQRNPETGGMRLLFDLMPDGSSLIEMRCALKASEELLSETWTYQWTPG